MKILYISQYFPPEAGATQTRAMENARFLASVGHKVTVLCEIPNHPAGVVFPGYRGDLFRKEEIDGIRVCYVRVFTSRKKNFITRLAFYFSFMFGASLAGMLMMRERFDLIYATSPPLPAAGAGLWLSRFLNIPLFFEVRDLWPDSAVILGELGNPWAIRIAKKLEHACYRKAAKVIAVTTGIQNILVKQKKLAAKKVALVPNGATLSSFYRDTKNGCRIRDSLHLDDKFVVLYAGIIGIAQHLETLLKTAKTLASDNDVFFIVAGAGPRKVFLETMAADLSLDNIRFIGEFPRKEMPGLYGAADVALVPLARKEIFSYARPSKMFDAWACETPILIGIEGEAHRLLLQCGGGLYYEPENVSDLKDKILEMKAMTPERRSKMGKDARAYVETCHSRREYAKLLEEILRSTMDRLSS